jgi:hypothetical protein
MRHLAAKSADSMLMNLPHCSRAIIREWLFLFHYIYISLRLLPTVELADCNDYGAKIQINKFFHSLLCNTW